MGSLISAENTWALWAILVGIAALAIWLEQKYSWASKITGCVLALLGMMILANVGIVPTESPVYDSVWDYVVPLAIPLLLFQCNIKKIGKESGRLLIIYLLSSVGTFLGAMGGYFLLLCSTALNICGLRGLSFLNGPVMESFGYVFVLFLSRLFFREPVTKRKLAGVGCILAGMLIYYL